MPKNARGFSLIEIAIVMVIMGLMLAGLLIPLGQQREQLRIREAKKQMADIEEALYGYAIINQKLPCPTDGSATSFGQELVSCSTTTNRLGFIPAATLGLAGNAAHNNLLLDPWGNPYQYAVASSFVSTITLSPPPAGDLFICDRASNPGAGCVAPSNPIAQNVAAVILSLGKHANDDQSDSADQLENAGERLPKYLWTIPAGAATYQYPQATDQIFVSRPPGEVADQEFDDQIIWISPATLFAKLNNAGRLL
jgi:hypothetical protein